MNTVETDPTGRDSMNRKATEKDLKATAIQPLLSTERSQKLDLLLHLISNIPEGLVLCGPLGIGKSTILNLVQAANLDSWTVCRVNASSTTHFDDIQAILVESVSGDAGTTLQRSGQDILSDCLSRFEHDEKFLVLLIDDAGEMVPGVLTAVCHFANSNPALRPVFTMTADRLHLMSSSDPAVGNCQVIEVPPLTEIQCGEFLQNLSGKSGALVSAKAITPALIQKVYRESHGVPGKVLSILSGLSKGQFLKVPGTSLPVYACITLVVAISIGYLLTYDSPLPVQTTVSSGAEAPDKGTVADPMAPLEKDSGRETSKPRKRELIDAEKDVSEAFVQPESLSLTGTSPKFGLEKEAFSEFTVGTGKGASESVGVPRGPLSQSNSDRDRPGVNSEASSPIPSSESSDVELAIEIENQTAGSGEGQSSPQVLPGEQSTNQLDDYTDGGVIQPDEKADAKTEQVGKPSKVEPVDPVIGTAGSEKTAALEESESAKASGVIAGVRDDRWIRKQNPQRFTLQLIAVKKFDAMKKFIGSHSHLESLAVFRTHKKGANWYALIQGVYPSLSAAKEASQKLPSGLRNAWPRKFKSVQKGMVDFDAE